MPQTIRKVCRVCGTDVSNQKRTKDTMGNYYCQPCYEKARAPAPQADGAFTCPKCKQTFNRNVMDQSGICKSCSSATSTPLDACGSCGASVGEDAAFCARCGAKQSGRLAPDDEVTVTSIIALLRNYAEASLAVAGGEEVEKAFTTNLIHGAAFGDADAYDRAKRLHADTTADSAQRARRVKQCEEIKTQLAAFDRTRVCYVRDLILQNDSVDESIKAGLRRDAAGIFGIPNLAVAGSATNPSFLPTTPRSPKNSAFVNGMWSAPTKRVTDKADALKPIIVGFLALISAGALAGSAKDSPALFAFSVLLALGGVSTMLAWSVILIIRKFTGSGAKAHATDAEPAASAPEKNSSRPFPVGVCIAIGMILVGITSLIFAIQRIVTTTPPSPDDIQFVVISLFVGVILVIVGFVTWSSACPNCKLLFTSEILDSEHLGTHVETRNESRVARTYDARGGPAKTETHYEVAIPVTVTTSRHTKLCKSCGHIWQTTTRSES